MRKRILSRPSQRPLHLGSEWLELEDLVQVELTSEDAAHPIESALQEGEGPGWRASEPGEQTVRLLFERPHSIRKIRLLFREEEVPRTQEFVLRCSADGGATYREVVRQQFNFSPPGTALEVEEYNVNLPRVTTLELQIVPDKEGGKAQASLAQLRLA